MLFWIHNVERIFWILTRKMPKSKESWDYGSRSGSGTAAMKNKELVTFSLFFSLVFSFAFLHHIEYWYWIEEGSHMKLIKVHYFLVNSLIFSPSFPLLFLISSPYSLGGATEGRWIIELVKVNCWSKPTFVLDKINAYKFFNLWYNILKFFYCTYKFLVIFILFFYISKFLFFMFDFVSYWFNLVTLIILVISFKESKGSLDLYKVPELGGQNCLSWEGGFVTNEWLGLLVCYT